MGFALTVTTIAQVTVILTPNSMPTAMLKSITLRRFHSILAETIHLSNPTFLVGCNGSGKSNLVDAFAFLSEAMEFPLQTVIDRRGGIHTLITRKPGERLRPKGGSAWTLYSSDGEVEPIFGMRVDFDSLPSTDRDVFLNGHFAFEVQMQSRYTYRIMREQLVINRDKGGSAWYDRRERAIESNMDFLKRFTPEFLSTSALLIQFAGGIYPFAIIQQFLRGMAVYSIEPTKLRNMQEPDVGSRLKTDGSNASSVLTDIYRDSPDDAERISELLTSISAGVTRVSPMRQGKQLTLRFLQNWGEGKRLDFEAYNMSDGLLRALGLILAVYQSNTPSVIVIEEPEVSVHPGALSVILDLLRVAAKRMQVVITTHSPDVLDAKWVNEESLRLVSLDEGISRVSGLSEFSSNALRNHLMGAGELLRANSLEPAPLFGAFPDSRQVGLFE
jgi:predicted ATPase